MGGAKLNTIFRAGSDHSFTCETRALRTMAYIERARDRQSPASQMNIQRALLLVAAERPAAPIAVMPMSTVPHPETAVNVAAASMVSRMYLRLSIARSCISGGCSVGRSGRTRDMEA